MLLRIFQQLLNNTLESIKELASGDEIDNANIANKELEFNSLSDNLMRIKQKTSELPCVTCLGVLQDYCEKSFIDKVCLK